MQTPRARPATLRSVNHWTTTVVHQGEERSPVLILDGFAPDPAIFVDDAAAREFAPIGPYYPGIRATVPAALIADLLAALEPLASETFGTGALSVVEAYYSIVTTPPSALAPIQRLPHIDGVGEDRLALLHYLSPDERGGTAFFRQRSTGYESVDRSRYPSYASALQLDVREHGLPDAAYIDGDTPLFACIARHQGCFNRAILYRSNTLHCADLPADLSLSPDPRVGRLTVNTFLSAA